MRKELDRIRIILPIYKEEIKKNNTPYLMKEYINAKGNEAKEIVKDMLSKRLEELLK